MFQLVAVQLMHQQVKAVQLTIGLRKLVFIHAFIIINVLIAFLLFSKYLLTNICVFSFMLFNCVVFVLQFDWLNHDLPLSARHSLLLTCCHALGRPVTDSVKWYFEEGVVWYFEEGGVVL